MPVPRTTTFLLVPWQDSARDIVTVFSSNGHSCAGATCPLGVPGFLAGSPVLLFVVALPFYVAGAFGRVCIAPVRWVYELRAACLRRSGGEQPGIPGPSSGVLQLASSRLSASRTRSRPRYPQFPPRQPSFFSSWRRSVGAAPCAFRRMPRTWSGSGWPVCGSPCKSRAHWPFRGGL